MPRFDPARYRVTIRSLTQAEGGGFLAEFRALPGCVGDGSTQAEALEDVRRAAICWMEAAAELGRDVPAPSVLGEAA